MKYNPIATALVAAILAALVLAGHTGQATGTGSSAATPPCTSAAGDRMQSGECLLPGQSIASANGCYAVVYQTDGNLVLYRTGSTRALWASDTAGSSAGRVSMQTDGNLVVYDASGTAVVSSNTAGNPGSWLYVQDDGNVVIYRTDGTAAWNTNTVQPPCTTAPPPSLHNGDANCDGTANPVDAALILQFGAGLAPSLPCPENADVNGDGQVNSIDDALILQYVAGYTTSPGGPVVAPPQPQPTQPPADARTQYSGATAEGGTVYIRVSADGTHVLFAARNFCGDPNKSLTVDNIRIVGHYFHWREPFQNEYRVISGTFAEDGSANGTVSYVDLYCDDLDVPWTAFVQ